MVNLFSDKHRGAELRLFELYARYVWPVHRLFFKKRLSRRCLRCALSEKARPLNTDGLCDLCVAQESGSADAHAIEHGAVDETLEQDMHEVMSGAAGSGAYAYDALVLFSGGKDSTLLVHTLKEKFPTLRILTITIDSGFMNPAAFSNISHVVKMLRVPHMTVRPDPVIYEKAFAYALTHLEGQGAAYTVDFLDGELFLDISRHVAAQMKIPLILTGFSYEQVTRYLSWHHFESDRSFELSRRETAARVYDVSVLTPEEHQSVWWDGTQYPEKDVARVLFPFYVWRYSEEYVKNQVATLGLIQEGAQSPLQTNNMLVPLEGLVDHATIGYSSWEPEFAKMIREGNADYAFWRNIFELLEYSAKTGHFIPASVEEVLGRLNLTMSDVGIMK